MNISETKTIGELWEESRIRYSRHTAVSDEQGSYSYEEANVNISKIRAYYQMQGIKAGDIIALESSNFAGFWFAVMAAVTIGCAYLPIPPQYPEERRNYMIQNSHAAIMLNKTKIEAILSDTAAPVSETISDTLESPCYVIYTSGTTGVPKGVVIRQKWLLNLCIWNQEVTELDDSCSVLSLNALCFDASVKNLFTPFMTGASLIMNIANPADIQHLYAYISEKKPTHLNATPSVIDVLLEEAQEHDYKGVQTIRCVMSGGESFQKKQLAEFFRAKLKQLHVLNVYGPTECTSVTAYHVLSEQELTQEEIPVPIGKPIRKKKIFLVNEQGNLCKNNEKGELYISGEGIAEGYLSDPEKTKQKFVIFEGERCYKSGDICFTDENQILYYCGRTDNQIKLNGYRIELEEISEKASVLEGIRAVKAMFIDNKIILFYSAVQQYPEQKLKDLLRKSLPEYMLPSCFIFTQEMPLTERGKTDTTELKKLYDAFLNPQSDEKNNSSDTQNTEEPIEERIIRIWQKLLQIQNIQIGDNFFDVGGNSLKLYKMGKMLEKEFSVKIEPLYLMELSSVRKIADFISKKIQTR